MFDLGCRLDEVGSRPRAVLNTFYSALALLEADERESFAASGSLAHEAGCGSDGNHSGQGGSELKITAEDVRWLKRAHAACEVGNVMSSEFLSPQ